MPSCWALAAAGLLAFCGQEGLLSHAFHGVVAVVAVAHVEARQAGLVTDAIVLLAIVLPAVAGFSDVVHFLLA